MVNIKHAFTIALAAITIAACSTDDEPKTPDTPNTPQQPSTPDKPDVPVVSDLAKLPVLHVEGRYLTDESGNAVNLHGFTQTYSPFFNNMAWNNYDVAGCLRYNKRMVDGIIDAGWQMNFVRLHLDPYWSDDPERPSVRYEGHERFSAVRFKKYLDELFIPMAEYFIDHGFYVVMRPPGVCPEEMAIGDSYHRFLKQVWEIIASHPKIINNTDIMFELANEPIAMRGADGNSTHWTESSWENNTKFFQEVIDVIRGTGCVKNVVWVPGLCWQQQYKSYARYRLKDSNMGFAVHCYPGWYGSDSEDNTGEGAGNATNGYTSFLDGWNDMVGCVAAFAPIMVTEIDWAPAKYNATWGKGITGVAGGRGFGANFKKIADDSGNVSWLFFTTNSEDLCNFVDVAPEDGDYKFLNDPEACPWAMYHWFKDYAK